MKDEIFYGSEVEIIYQKGSSEIYFSYEQDYVTFKDFEGEYKINTSSKVVIFNAIYDTTHISAPANCKMNNFIIKSEKIVYDSVINTLDWFPVINGKTITSKSEIIPYSYPSGRSEVSIMSSAHVLQLAIPKEFGDEFIEDLKFVFSLNLGNTEKNEVKLPDKTVVPYFNYSVLVAYWETIVTYPISELKLTGVTFDHILSGAKKTENEENSENIITPQMYRRNINAVSTFQQVTTSKLIICSGSYVEMFEKKNEEGNNKPSFVDFVFTQTSFPPFLDTDIDFSNVNFTFMYDDQDNGTYDFYGFLFNKFIPIAFIRSSLCSDLSLEIENTENMTVKCEDLWTGVEDHAHAVISVKLITTLIETPDFNKKEFLEIVDVEPYKLETGLGLPAIIGISVGAAAVVIIAVVVVVVVIICKRRRGEKSNNSSFGSDGGVQL